MRVYLSKKELERLFNGFSSSAHNLGVSTKTIRNWKYGKHSLPDKAFKALLKFNNLMSDSFYPRYTEEHAHLKLAARQGGLKTAALYGNFGTLQGRRKGGLNSIAKNKTLNNAFKLLKPLGSIPRNEKLAELLGIFFGDGHLGHYQAQVVTNSETDMGHAFFIKNLIKSVSGLDSVIKERKQENAVNITVSSKNFCDFLHKVGMPKGNKIQNNLEVPRWINNSKKFQRAFLRGLFDTDGSVYLDKHKVKGMVYRSVNLAITSYSPSLIKGIIKILQQLDIKYTYSGPQHSVYIRRNREVLRFFSQVSSSNEKHRNRFNNFMEEYRSGHNGAVSKTAVAL